MEAKIFEYRWDSMGYGDGVLLVAAMNKEDADAHAELEDRRWAYDCERNNIAYTGDVKYLPLTIVESHYQE